MAVKPAKAAPKKVKAASTTKYVLVHCDYGILIGYINSSLCWSKTGALGVRAASAFLRPDMVENFLDQISGLEREDLLIVPVETVSHSAFVSIEELIHAGLEAHLGELAHPGWANPGGYA